MSNGLERVWNIARLPIVLTIVLTLLLVILRLSGLPSAAILSLVSAVIGGLIATGSQAWFSEQDRQTQLRLAAMDKRLEAHQQAYELWRKLCYRVIDVDALDGVILQCQEWWDGHCLYLTGKAREAFRSAYLDAKLIRNLRSARDSKGLLENWGRITEAGKTIEMGVYLPSISGEKDEFPQPTLPK